MGGTESGKKKKVWGFLKNMFKKIICAGGAHELKKWAAAEDKKNHVQPSNKIGD